MAEVTRTGAATAGGGDTLGLASGVDGVIEPHAVRVRLAAVSRVGDEPALRIARTGQSPQVTSPTAGRGSPDGAPVPPVPPVGATPVGGGAAGVLAQGRSVQVDGLPVDVTLRAMGSGRYLVTQDGTATRVILEAPAAGVDGVHRREVLVDGFRFEVEAESERIAALRERATRGRAVSAHSGPLEVRAIIPGKVVVVSVVVGDEVTAGQQLLVVEAMKMQNELRAPRDGTITRVGVAPGVSIDVGDLLVVLN